MSQRSDTAMFIRAALHGRLRMKNRVFHEVSIRQEPSITPAGFADCWHLDVVGLESQRSSPQAPYRIAAFEIKSCRADFDSDTKWKNYLPRVDSLTFVCPPDTIAVEDIGQSGVGLLEVKPRIYKAWDSEKKRYDAQWREIKQTAWAFDMPFLSRFDIMYGMAINKAIETDWEQRLQEYAEKIYSKPSPTSQGETE